MVNTNLAFPENPKTYLLGKINSVATSMPTATKVAVESLNHAIIEGIRDKKGKNILQLDLRHLGDAPADFFIICEGDSNVHVKSISDSIHKRVREDVLTKPAHVEGSIGAKWVLMDYFDTIVHVFHPESREFYDIENLWSDARVTEFAEI